MMSNSDDAIALGIRGWLNILAADAVDQTTFFTVVETVDDIYCAGTRQFRVPDWRIGVTGENRQPVLPAFFIPQLAEIPSTLHQR